MVEKRLYQRVIGGINGNFIIRNKKLGCIEFTGVIDDLSENGIRISITDSNWFENVKKIETGDKLLFQALDEYKLHDEVRVDIFSAETEVIRLDDNGDSIVIGCKIYESSREFDEYIKNRKMALFIERGYILD